MEDQFKRALKNSRISAKNSADSFSEALFELPWIEKSIELNTEANNQQEASKEVVNNLSEKLKTLDELTNFTSGEFSKKPHLKSINIEGGGQIVKKENLGSLKAQARSLDSLIQFNNSHQYLGLNKKYEQVVKNEAIDILFVCDTAINPREEVSEVLELFYEKNVCTLFSKMINAMKLNQSRILISSLNIENEEEDYKSILLSEVLLFKPRIIITLGGGVSMNLLDTKKRLQSIHGQFFDFQVGDHATNKHSCKLMPLFSPSYINEAPNTKRIAWEDMQKVMRELGIIS